MGTNPGEAQNSCWEPWGEDLFPILTFNWETRGRGTIGGHLEITQGARNQDEGPQGGKGSHGIEFQGRAWPPVNSSVMKGASFIVEPS